MTFTRLTITLILLLVLLGCSQSNNNKNRLINASSPYLKEHADNPVDWYEWGDEALSKAKKENKPLLISIGYASCHWCHEMEKESFMDTAVARIMNENFICIKVDREERPDIDNVYMNALQLLSGDTGWPLNAFALPDGKPFFAGTYYTQKSWISLLQNISKSFRSKNTLVRTQANAIVNGLAQQELSLIDTIISTDKPLQKDYLTLIDSIYKEADLVNGGLKGSQKFPSPSYSELLLQHYYITRNPKPLEIALNTLNKMVLSGLYDQVGGGFSRYTTDSLWQVPHFEKMLYDNAQLVSLYAHAYQITKNDFYKTIVTETINFIDQNLAAPGGGFYSSLNADTNEGEGAFYTWAEADFMKALKGDKTIATYYNVTTKGNWKNGTSILRPISLPAEFALQQKLSPEGFNITLANAKKSLQQERSKRTSPTVDTKIITAWNCIMIKAYTDAYAATGNGDYLTKAKAGASFIEKNLLEKDGGLKRNFKDGKTFIDGFLDDYAWAATAFLRLYEISFDLHYLYLSKKITDLATNQFLEKRTGLFYYSKNPNDLVVRKTAIADDAIPSSNAIMAKVLYTLGVVYDDTAYTNKSLQLYYAVQQRVKAQPRYHIQWCNFAGFLSGNSYEIVIIGTDALKKNNHLQQTYLPTSIVLGSRKEEMLPLLQDKLVPGKTFIYICTNKLCKKPVEDIESALLQLK